MGDFIRLTNGRLVEANANAASAGSVDAGKLVKLDAGGKIDPTMLPVGPETRSMVASENLSAGDVVNLWNDAGTIKMRRADADNGRAIDGFVVAAVANGATGTVNIEEGVITGLDGLTIGAIYWLSTTAGALTVTAPTGTGVLAQIAGKALSASEFLFKPQAAIEQVA